MSESNYFGENEEDSDDSFAEYSDWEAWQHWADSFKKNLQVQM